MQYSKPSSLNLPKLHPSNECLFMDGGSGAGFEFSELENEDIIRKYAPISQAHKLSSQYRWLKERQGLSFIPKVLDEGYDNRGNYFYEMEFYSNFKPFFDLIHEAPISQSKELLKNIVSQVHRNIHKTKETTPSKEAFQSYIKLKGFNKIKESVQLLPQYKDVLNHKEIIINDKKYINFPIIMEKISKKNAYWNSLPNEPQTSIHGDLTVENIIVNEKNFITLDSNDENILSNPTVEFSKLFQSFYGGYEFLKFSNRCTWKGKKISFSLTQSKQYKDLSHSLTKELIAKKLISCQALLKFHCAMHFCRLLPYQAIKKPSTFLIYYSSMVKIFNEFYGDI